MYSEVECSFEKRVPLCEPGKCVGLCMGYSVQCPDFARCPWSSTPKACLRDGGNKAKCQLRMQCTTICWPFLQNATQHCKDVARCCLLVFYMLVTDRRLARARFRDSWSPELYGTHLET